MTPLPVITWEAVREAYSAVAVPYWLAMLDEALARFPDLVTKRVNHAARSMTGVEIVLAFRAGTLTYLAMGRGGGGLVGGRIRKDIESGTWRETAYQGGEGVAGQQQLVHGWRLRAALGFGGCTGRRPSRGAQVRVGLCHQRAHRSGRRSVGRRPVGAAGGRLRPADPNEVQRIARLYRQAAETAPLGRSEAAGLFSLLPGDPRTRR